MTTTKHPEWAHRTLRISRHFSGDDIRRLQTATGLRLSARGEHRLAPAVDGQYGPQTAGACSRALYLLGGGDKYVQEAHPEHGGIIDVYHQHMIRHPGSRNQRQLQAATRRMRKVRAAHDRHRQKAETHRQVERVIAAAELALHNAPAVHYTQGPARWQGISEKRHASDGAFPNYADCSSFFSWCWWNVLGDGDDVLNGASWLGGYTGTLAVHGTLVSDPIAGAAVLYGPGWPYEHVALAVGGGQVISHGSEGGPYLLPYNYRADVAQIRVYH